MAKKNKPLVKKSKAAVAKTKASGKTKAVGNKKMSAKAGAKNVAKKTAKKSNKKMSGKAVAKKVSAAKYMVKTPSKGNNKGLKKTIKGKTSSNLPSAGKNKIDFTHWVTPLDDRILVQMLSEERITPGGLYIPDTVADVSGNFKGLVVAVGRGHLDKKGKIRPLDVKKGDKVVFSQFSGSKIELQGESVIFIRESDVLGIVNK